MSAATANKLLSILTHRRCVPSGRPRHQRSPVMLFAAVIVFSVLWVQQFSSMFEGESAPGQIDILGAESGTAALRLVPAHIDVAEGETFSVDVYLDSSTSPVSAVDVLYSVGDDLEVVGIVPDFSAFPVFLPATPDGGFDETDAIAGGRFGAARFNWGMNSIMTGVSGTNIHIARLDLRAYDFGTSQLSFIQSLGSYTDSNIMWFDRLEYVDLLSVAEMTVSIDISCVPDCVEKVCGEDGCGGSCGTCQSGKGCQEGVCIDVADRELF